MPLDCLARVIDDIKKHLLDLMRVTIAFGKCASSRVATSMLLVRNWYCKTQPRLNQFIDARKFASGRGGAQNSAGSGQFYGSVERSY